jgi:hypothetical protein
MANDNTAELPENERQDEAEFDDEAAYYHQYAQDFFDLIIIDEYCKRGQKTIINTLLQRIDINSFSKIFISINIVLAFWRCSLPQLHRRKKIFQNSTPTTFIICPTPMQLINNN